MRCSSLRETPAKLIQNDRLCRYERCPLPAMPRSSIPARTTPTSCCTRRGGSAQRDPPSARGCESSRWPDMTLRGSPEHRGRGSHQLQTRARCDREERPRWARNTSCVSRYFAKCGWARGSRVNDRRIETDVGGASSRPYPASVRARRRSPRSYSTLLYLR